MSEFAEKLPKRIFVACLTFLVLLSAFFFGALAYRNDLPPIPQLRAAYDSIATVVDVGLADSPYHHHLQPSRGQGDGVTVNKTPEDGALILMAGFFDEETQARLIRRDGSVVRKWSLDYLEHFPDTGERACERASSLDVDVHGAHLTPRGELVFNYEYCGAVKLDRCGGVIWELAKPTHHSVVPAMSGGYWLVGQYQWPGDEQPDRFPPFSTAAQGQTILEDTILKIGEDGEVLQEVSIPELMRENSLEALLTATGDDIRLDTVNRAELVHANKVAELPSEIADAFPLFAAGDLVISMRDLNLVIVVDPAAKTVKWRQTGPWLRQHDPEFRPDGRISIFNNNVYRTAYDNYHTVLDTPFTTNIIAIDPATRETEVLFGEKPGQEMLAVIRGQHELLEDDGMLITEFDAGRVLEVDADGEILWEYVNAYDDDFVGEVTNAALYPADYFTEDWTACER